MDRHYGLDWLRVGAFALLIFYHVGMVFVPWDYHVKTATPSQWIAIPMLATNSWRLMLLFVVSGYASRALFAKGGGTRGFVTSRSKRLLIPLLFGVIVIVPVQPWIELVTKYGYPHGFGWFLLHDYFSFRSLNGIVLPNWQHLWFVAYLWTYTMVLALGLWLARGRSMQWLFDRVFGTAAVLLVPIAWLLFVDMFLLQGARETHDLVRDAVAHLHYFPGFLFGFALARSEPAMAAIGRWWKPAAAAAVLGYLVVAVIEWHWPGSSMPQPFGFIFACAHVIQGWCTIVALIGIAERYWNHDHPWRKTLTEAVFPFYIIHQTVIVGFEWLLLPFHASPALEFAILVAATVAACWAFYLLGREVGWLRPLIGLRGLTPPRTRPGKAPLAASKA
ncbi:MAG: acyltransferase family protein [Pseudomonadota bacterium]